MFTAPSRQGTDGGSTWAGVLPPSGGLGTSATPAVGQSDPPTDHTFASDIPREASKHEGFPTSHAKNLQWHTHHAPALLLGQGRRLVFSVIAQ